MTRKETKKFLLEDQNQPVELDNLKVCLRFYFLHNFKLEV